MSSLNLSSATCWLVVVSLASKMANTKVFCGELGDSILTIWKFILNVLPPVSPPIFTHSSSFGMPSCHRIPPQLKVVCIRKQILLMLLGSSPVYILLQYLEDLCLQIWGVGISSCLNLLSTGGEEEGHRHWLKDKVVSNQLLCKALLPLLSCHYNPRCSQPP